MADPEKYLMQFSSADGGMVVNAEHLEIEELLAIALHASHTGRRIIISGVTNKERELLERIAKVGKGLILFDLR